MKEDLKGEVSEWNEGNFKSMRLHEAQNLINNSRVDPFRLFFGKFGYELWFKAIDILFAEGQQKYSEVEYEEVKTLKLSLEKDIQGNRVCSVINHNSKRGIIINLVAWDKIKPLLEEFEYKVRKYNDKHGLSTRNIGTKGMF